MKKLTLLLVLFSLSASAQFKTVINPTNRIATLRNDSLWVHTRLEKPVEYNKFQLGYTTINGKTYRFKIAYYDPSLFWSEYNKNTKKQILIY